MLADVSHLVRASHWSCGGRPCECRTSITEPCDDELAFQHLEVSRGFSFRINSVPHSLLFSTEKQKLKRLIM